MTSLPSGSASRSHGFVLTAPGLRVVAYAVSARRADVWVRALSAVIELKVRGACKQGCASDAALPPRLPHAVHAEVTEPHADSASQCPRQCALTSAGASSCWRWDCDRCDPCCDTARPAVLPRHHPAPRERALARPARLTDAPSASCARPQLCGLDDVGSVA